MVEGNGHRSAESIKKAPVAVHRENRVYPINGVRSDFVPENFMQFPVSRPARAVAADRTRQRRS